MGFELVGFELGFGLVGFGFELQLETLPEMKPASIARPGSVVGFLDVVVFLLHPAVDQIQVSVQAGLGWSAVLIGQPKPHRSGTGRST